MHKIRYIFCLFIALMALLSCSKDDDDNNTVVKPSEDAFPYMARYTDSEIDSILKKEELRILYIGNSYTEDYTTLLSALTQNTPGCDISGVAIYDLMRGSGSFKSWYNCAMGSDNAEYTAMKVVDKIGLDLPVGKSAAHDTTTIAAYMAQQWDIVIIQQASNYANDFSQWTGSGDGGYLLQWANYIHKHQPDALMGFVLIHSYASSYGGNTEGSHATRWQHYSDAVKQLQKEYPVFQLIIPVGTAIENLRATGLNDSYDLTRDGTHLGYGLARYTAACCFYQKVLHPRTGASLEGNVVKDGAVRSWELNDKTAYPYILVNDSNKAIALDCVAGL